MMSLEYSGERYVTVLVVILLRLRLVYAHLRPQTIRRTKGKLLKEPQETMDRQMLRCAATPDNIFPTLQFLISQWKGLLTIFVECA